MLIRRLILSASTLALLGGCAAFMPDHELRASTSATTYESRRLALADAKTYAKETIGLFDNIILDSSDLDRAAVYTLFGLGTASGVIAVTGDSISPVKSLALAAAGVLGLRQVIKPTDQKKIASIAQEGVKCALDIAIQLENLNTPINTASLTAYSSGASAALVALMGHADIQARETAKAKGNLDSRELAAAAVNTVRAAQEWETAYKTQAHFALATEAGEKLVSTVKSASEGTNLAQQLSKTVENIRIKAAEQLASLNDPTTIYTDIQKELAGSSKNVTEARRLAEEYRKKIQVPENDGSAKKVAAELDHLLVITAAADSAMQRCINPATPPSS
jgi:hypothetical protein